MSFISGKYRKRPEGYNGAHIEIMRLMRYFIKDEIHSYQEDRSLVLFLPTDRRYGERTLWDKLSIFS